MRALLVDDERLARNELRRLLRAHPDVTVVGEAANVDEAAQQLASMDVDVLFLDVQMPGASGFSLLERLDQVPLVIFTTAYDEFAVRAFDVDACDYLLKPIRPERLGAAVDRTRRALAEQAERIARGAARLEHERIFIRDGERCWLVALTDIALFEAEGNYTRISFGSHAPLVRTPLHDVLRRLDPATFFRVSRSQVVNLRFVATIAPAANDGYVARLTTGRDVLVSRRQARQLRETLSL